MSWLKAPNIQTPHCFFDRTGGVSEGVYTSLNCGPGSSDNHEYISQNRKIAAAHITGSDETPVVTGYQIHSAKVHTVDADWGNNRPKGDGFASSTPDLILGVLTADCAPVLFYDANAKIIGAAHAGWRGAVAGVTDQVLNLMTSMGASAENIHVAVGPTIASASYEVGPDMRAQALDADVLTEDWFTPGNQPDRWQFDLTGYLKSRLRARDVASLWCAEVDTYKNEDCFSFRRTTHQGDADYGRQLSAIMLG